MPLDPAYKAGLAGHLPVNGSNTSNTSRSDAGLEPIQLWGGHDTPARFHQGRREPENQPRPEAIPGKLFCDLVVGGHGGI